MRLRHLMSDAQRGDKAAYAALLKDCPHIIRAVARRHGASVEMLDDVVQDVLLTIHRARHTYDPERPFLVWLSMITHRRVIDTVRRIGRQGAHEVREPAAYESYSEAGQEPEPFAAGS
ncbi:MAG: RNA polymerase sigma factor, partial [Methylobacteriaceae bacterium]|nr:RNA polymerase sigma factor [Methylobacteriaceae bacterium]